MPQGDDPTSTTSRHSDKDLGLFQSGFSAVPRLAFGQSVGRLGNDVPVSLGLDESTEVVVSHSGVGDSRKLV